MIRVGVLGAGYFARFHHDAWTRLGNAQLVGIADRDPARARGGPAPGYESLPALIDGAAPELLDIVIPPDGHLEAIRTALDAGLRWIICQKPFCRDRDEAARATEMAEAAGATLVIHENFRFQPWYRTLKQALDGGRIGDVLQLTFRMRTGDGQGPDAYLDRQPYFQTMERFLIHETAVHWIDTFRFLLGPADGLYADLRRLNPAIAGEDAGYLLFDYADGRRALFDGNRLLDHGTDTPRLTFGEALAEGTGGSIALAGDGALTIRRAGAVDGSLLLPPRRWPGFAGDCVHALQAHVLNHITDGTPLENTAREYLAVLDIEAAAYRSAERRARVEL